MYYSYACCHPSVDRCVYPGGWMNRWVYGALEVHPTSVSLLLNNIRHFRSRRGSRSLSLSLSLPGRQRRGTANKWAEEGNITWRKKGRRGRRRGGKALSLQLNPNPLHTHHTTLPLSHSLEYKSASVVKHASRLQGDKA